MGSGTPAQALLRRLDRELARTVPPRGPVVIAYSGGLASLLLAALIRKRAEIHCEVLGLPGSADAQAAVVAETYLDYPVHVVRATPAQVLRSAQRLVAQDAMPPESAVSLVPLALIEARHPRTRVVSGFGLTWDSPPVRAFLDSDRSLSPGLRARGVAPPPRSQLLAIADLLGLPEAFSRAARRRPAEGSAVGPLLRAAAHAQHTSLDRLLRGLGPPRDNQQRRATRVVPKSLPVD